jgi:hypothetical protein
MLNINSASNAQSIINAIAAIENEFGNRSFTRAQYESFRDTCPTVEKYNRRGRRYTQSVQPALQTLVDAKIIIVIDVEEFERVYVEDKWGDKEFIPSADYKQVENILRDLSSNSLGEMLLDELHANVDSIDCKRYFYKLNYRNLGDYIRAEMPWITKALIGGAF